MSTDPENKRNVTLTWRSSMFATIATWTVAALGMAVLLVMAFGALAIDFDTPPMRRRRKPAE
ncbi:hypothetical protein [Thermocrispum municipale]|uniref:hypothetical protein n=1 Tax=Thermocrispum municipale TaxID=37926 RepID=UPI001B7FE0E7|nr:hypothetical protein [Thermocrispum municipale]